MEAWRAVERGSSSLRRVGTFTYEGENSPLGIFSRRYRPISVRDDLSNAGIGVSMTALWFDAGRWERGY